MLLYVKWRTMVAYCPCPALNIDRSLEIQYGVYDRIFCRIEAGQLRVQEWHSTCISMCIANAQQGVQIAPLRIRSGRAGRNFN